MTRALKSWFVGLVLTVAFVWFSVEWFDRPIALWVHDIFGTWRSSLPIQSATRILSTQLGAAVLFVILGLVAIMGRRFSNLEAAIAVSTISSLATLVVNSQLKFAFGRTWPDPVEPGMVSLLHDNAYGFHFFKFGPAFESFPSGHAAFAAAVLFSMWIFFPKCRVICAIGIVAVDVGLLMLNLHFLSDVVAGTFLGLSTGLFTFAILRATDFRMMSSNLSQVGKYQHGVHRDYPIDTTRGDKKIPSRTSKARYNAGPA
jgi:membrane-associated phospholipid phosphatase